MRNKVFVFSLLLCFLAFENSFAGSLNKISSKNSRTKSIDLFRFNRIIRGSYFLHVTKKGKTIIVNGTDTVCEDGYEAEGNLCYECCRDGYQRHFSNICISKKLLCPIGFNQIGKNCYLESCPINLLTRDSFCEDSCPRGFQQIDSKTCESGSSSCPSNYEVKGDYCVLKSCGRRQVMLNGVGCVDQSFVSCPSGFNLEGTLCKRCKSNNSEPCIDYEETCPLGWFHLSKEQCAMICPEGTAALGSYCTSLKVKTCPENYLRIQDQGCVRTQVCPEGFEIRERECIPKPKSKCAKYTLNGKCLDECPEGFVEHDNTCIKITSKCPHGYYQLAGEYCVTLCPTNFTSVAGKCMASKFCDIGKYFHRGSCLEKCPNGYVQDDNTKSCYADKNACNSGEVLNLNSCVSKEQCENDGRNIDENFNSCIDKMQCRAGYYYFGDYCLKECPVGFEVYSGNCRRKPANSCYNGIFYNGQCLSECPEGTHPKLGVCVKIDPITPTKCGINMQKVECNNEPNCQEGCECKEGFIRQPSADYCIPKNPVCPDERKLDVVFVIDGSDDVGESNFNLLKLFLLESLTHIYTSKTDLRVGFVIYGPSKIKIVYLYEKKLQCDMIPFVTGLTLLGGKSTTLIDGLRVARELVLSQCNGARIGVAKQLYVLPFSTKFTSDLMKEVRNEIVIHQAAGFRVAFITIGEETEELTGLPDNVYNLHVAHISLLSRYSYKVAAITCRDYVCPSGYKSDGKYCVDDDECEVNPCHSNSKCYNEPGTFKCFCPDGEKYVDHRVGCSNGKPECKVKTTEVCDVIQCVGNATCSSSNGFGFCVCPKGFTYSAEKGCTDLNECSMNPCLDNATCLNDMGSFTCNCPKGYQYNKHFGCVDMNECKVLNSPCSGNGECKNTVGSYECVCKQGYEYVKDVGCKDINECIVANPCKGERVQCENTDGAFKCVCEKGYEYGPDGCGDINECDALGDAACGTAAKCVNQEGSYSCQCDKGFLYDEEAKDCKVIETEDKKQRKADLVFIIDSSDKLLYNFFDDVKDMVESIITDYDSGSTTVKKLFFGLQLGGNEEFRINFNKSESNNAVRAVKNLNYLGGEANLRVGLSEARSLYTNQGQENATKLVFLITATSLKEDQEELSKIKHEVDEIKKEGSLVVIHIGHNHTINVWKPIFKEKELEKNVITVTYSFIKTVHKLVYEKSDTLITCPSGFVFKDNVCQYITAKTKYCSFDDKLYAINATWVSQCAEFKCTERGVMVENTKCLGFDGDCYKENTFFPCQLKGELHWQCRCHVTKYLEKKTGHYQQEIKYTIISFNKEKAINETLTEDGKLCEFPFKYDEEWHYACTKDRGGYRWCSHYRDYYPGYFSYCKSVVKKQCVFSNGKVYNEGDMWSHNCNDIVCNAGTISITAKCETADKQCVNFLADDYSCIIDGKRYSRCICSADSYGYGKNQAVSGEVTGNEGKHKTGFGEFCEQPGTGIKHEEGARWTVDCYTLECIDGKTTVVDKMCKSSDETCHSVGASGFTCLIKNIPRSNCTCEQHGQNLALVSYERGEKVTELTSGEKFIKPDISSKLTGIGEED